MTERQTKLQKLRAQADLYARRLDRERSRAVHPAGAKPYADMVAKDPTGVRAAHSVGCRAAECDSCGVTG